MLEEFFHQSSRRFYGHHNTNGRSGANLLLPTGRLLKKRRRGGDVDALLLFYDLPHSKGPGQKRVARIAPLIMPVLSALPSVTISVMVRLAQQNSRLGSSLI